MFKRILVTGGAGFIGSHMADLLLERGYQVRVFDNLEPQVHGDGGRVPDYLSKDVEFVRGDVRDRGALLTAMRGCDAIIHDAAMVGVGQSQYQVMRYADANVTGTANLLDLLVTEKTGIQRLLVASSMSLYGEGMYRRPSDGAAVFPQLRPDEQLAKRDFEMRDPLTGEVLQAAPTPEEKPLHCTSVYALTKKDQEEYSILVGRAHNIPVVACRYFNVYGPRQSLSNPYTGVAAIFSSRIKNGKAPLIYEDGCQSRDFINVRDLVEAKLFLLENPAANHAPYDLCTGRATSVADISRHLARLMKRPELEPEIPGSYRSGDIRHCIGDPAKVTALGWRARIAVEDGLRELVQWSESVEAVDEVDKAHRELVSFGLIKE